MISPSDQAEIRSCFERQGFAFKHGQGLLHASWVREHRGTEIQLRFHPVSRTRYAGEIRYTQRIAFRLSFYAKASARTRVQVTNAGSAAGAFVTWVRRRRGYERLTTTSPALLGLSVWAIEPSWAEGLLQGEVSIGAALRTLFVGGPESQKGHTVLIINPESIEYQCRMTEVSELARLAELSEAFEKVLDGIIRAPSPEKISELTKTERYFANRPILLAVLLILGLVTAVGVVFLLLFGLFLLIAVR